MPSEKIIHDLCSRCCVWHKPGRKEELSCGGVIAIEKLGSGSVPPAEQGEERNFKNKYSELLYELVCKLCPFLLDGCDFRDASVEHSVLPCGGVVLMDRLLISGNITEGQLRDILSNDGV